MKNYAQKTKNKKQKIAIFGIFTNMYMHTLFKKIIIKQ